MICCTVLTGRAAVELGDKQVMTDGSGAADGEKVEIIAVDPSGWACSPVAMPTPSAVSV